MKQLNFNWIFTHTTLCIFISQGKKAVKKRKKDDWKIHKHQKSALNEQQQQQNSFYAFFYLPIANISFPQKIKYLDFTTTSIFVLC